MNIDKLKDLKINSKGFAFDSRTGNTYSINATGLFVINGMKSGMPYLQMICKMAERFDVDGATAVVDAENFLEELERKHFVQLEASA